MLRLLLTSFLLVIFLAQPAFARIDIVPRKIVMDPRDRSAELTVLNLMGQPGTYRVDIVTYQQNLDGTYTTLETPLNPAFNPDQAVRFSPRQFSLPVQGRQKIRLSLRKPANLPEGEYRFHVQVMRLADARPTQSVEPGQGARLSVQMNMGVTIPVIVRHGGVEQAAAKISNPRLVTTNTESERPELQMTITRQGDTSTIGSLEAFWVPASGEPKSISYIDNMNIFTEINQRQVALPLNELPRGSGQILVRYIDNSKTASDGRVIDEVAIGM